MRESFHAPVQPGTGTSRTNAAGRLLAVLDAFGPRQRALSLSEISRRAGLSLSTAHRLVCELERWGALERGGGGRVLDRAAAAGAGGAVAAGPGAARGGIPVPG